MDCSPPGSFVHGVSQARTLEWVTLYYSSVSSWPRGRTRVSCKTPALQADSLALSHHLIIRVLPSWPHLDLLLLLLLSHYSCVRLCTTPPGSPIPGILQERTLEWVAISFSNAWKWKVKAKLLSRVWLLVTPWTAAYQAPPSMGFSRQEYWSGVPLPSPI